MASQFWEVPLNAPLLGAGTAYNTSTTLTDVSPAPQYVLPANSLIVGSHIRVTAAGTFSNTGTPTLLLGIYLGGVAGVALAATGATTTTTAATNWPWRIRVAFTVRTIGATGTLMPVGGYLFLATSLTNYSVIPVPATALANVTRDTTASNIISLGAQWGTSNAANTLTCHSFLVEGVA